jgi:lysophospholipase
MMATEAHRGEGVLHASGGKQLRYRTWEARSPRAALAVVHGLGEHSGRYEALGQDMCAHAVSAYALDLRGHGRSDGQRGHASRFGVILQDIDRFRREVLGLVEPGTPLFLLGHSMGGLIALRYMEEFAGACEGAIILSPWLATAVQVPRWKITLSNPLAKIAPALPFRSGLNPVHLSRDPAVVRAYVEDPLVHDRITPRFFTELSIAMGQAFQRSDRLTKPLLFLLAGADRIVDTDRTLAFARSLDNPAVETRVYSGHFHELLNEPDAVRVRRDMLVWLEERLDAMGARPAEGGGVAGEARARADRADPAARSGHPGAGTADGGGPLLAPE